MEHLRVELGRRSYDILIGSAILHEAGRHIAPLLKLPRVTLVTDENVGPQYAERVEHALAEHGVTCETVTLPVGEQTKDFAHLQTLTEGLLASHAERDMALLALGGGVIGDLTGFAASVLLRGVDFIQLPTTLLAQVDSSVGGKTGINTRQGKNLIGSFYQPRLVLADTATLETLPARELRAGYAEIVKYALIDDRDFFAWLESHGAGIVNGNADAQRHAVGVSCRAKARIVEEDERENCRRALLNFGHTFAHALEAETAYGPEILHGEAVALGMILAFRLSAELGLCPARDAERVTRHLAKLGLPTEFSQLSARAWQAEALLDHMKRDKKTKGGRLRLILARGIGKAFVTDDVSPDHVEALLARSIGAAGSSSSAPLVTD